jgi:hypothetical protein
MFKTFPEYNSITNSLSHFQKVIITLRIKSFQILKTNKQQKKENFRKKIEKQILRRFAYLFLHPKSSNVFQKYHQMLSHNSNEN